MINGLGKEIPEYIEGIGKLKPYRHTANNSPKVTFQKSQCSDKAMESGKLLPSLKDAILASGLEDGMTISFHHHLRNGDHVVSMVLDLISEIGYSDITIAPSALFPVHESVIKHIKSGVVRAIQGSVNGPVGRLASNGGFNIPVLLRSHGGRARAIESGDLTIDIAFIAAPSADNYGNINGLQGPSACGSLGYCFADACYAKKVIAITDNLVEYPLSPISVSQNYVDFVVKVDQIGDPSGIVSGTLQVTRDPIRLIIAENAARVIDASGLIQEGFSFQTGAGGISLAAGEFIREMMIERKIRGSFGSGGITEFFVQMLEENLLEALLDVQSFDLEAVRSFRENQNHIEMGASFYANPHNKGCAVNKLDTVILGATQVDTDFNVNVNTESDGVLLHGIGGHMDTAAGAKLTIITTPLLRGRLPMVVNKVITVTTPGSTIDVVVTERGIAVNPKHPELENNLKNAGLHVVNIHDLKNEAYSITGTPEDPEFLEKIIGVVEYRDGTVLDVIRQVKE